MESSICPWPEVTSWKGWRIPLDSSSCQSALKDPQIANPQMPHPQIAHPQMPNSQMPISHVPSVLVWSTNVLSTDAPELRLPGMEDPTWFWGGVQPWKPPPRHISSKRFDSNVSWWLKDVRCGLLGHKYVQPNICKYVQPNVSRASWLKVGLRYGPLGHKYVQPTWETTYNKTYRKPTTTSTTQYFTESTRCIATSNNISVKYWKQPILLINCDISSTIFFYHFRTNLQWTFYQKNKMYH